MIENALAVLQNIFGYREFRLLQQKIIENVLEQKDTLVIMPTGSGKSLCYQIPALLFPGLTIVISPLISLMKDQVEQLKALDIPAAYLNSSLTYQEYNTVLCQVREGKLKLLYLAPETLLKPQIIQLVQTVKVAVLAIDEAHCISEWGHDFRPEYRQLVTVRKLLAHAVCIALTATATPRVREDIKNNLGFQNSNTFLSSFDRDNLMIEIVPKENPEAQLLDFISRFPGQAGIVYCNSKRQVDNTTAALVRAGYSARSYHADLPDIQRKENQELFLRDDIQIIVATIAFGMGINKSNVRFVLHYDLPQNIESYYQQIGRAGRDGLKSHCLLLYSYGDTGTIQFFIRQKQDPFEQRLAQVHLNSLLSMIETGECRRVPLLRYFGEEYNQEKCGMCDNCLSGKKEETDLTIPAQKFMSCIKRTGERFGTTHVINVLRGSNEKKVLSMKHHELSTYGIGKEFSAKQWKNLSRQLISKRMVVQDVQFGNLQLTSRAYQVLRSEEKFFGTIIDPEVKYSATSAQKSGQEQSVRPDLLEKLKIMRKTLADNLKVPPFVIFSDKTLHEMAGLLPLSPGEMLTVYGVARAKLDKFGEQFLEVIREYCREKGIEKKALPEEVAPLLEQGNESSDGPKKHHQSAELFREGLSLEAIASRHNIKEKTVVSHLYHYLKEGNSLPVEKLLGHIRLDEAQEAAAEKSFEKNGYEYLKPVYEELQGKVDYDTLHLVRLVYLARHT